MDRLVVLFCRNFNGGGIERVFIELAVELDRLGYDVKFVVCDDGGVLRDSLPSHIPLKVLRPNRSFLAFFRRLRLARRFNLSFLGYFGLLFDGRYFFDRFSCLEDFSDYLREQGSCSVLIGGTGITLMGLWARILSGVSCRVIVSEHNHLSSYLQRSFWNNYIRRFWLCDLFRGCYVKADGIISVSNGIGDDFSGLTGISRDLITTIYNPVLSPSRCSQLDFPCPHIWFSESTPVILSSGRLVGQKDYPTLLRAFAHLRAKRAVRLIILGDGGQLSHLRFLAGSLGILSDVTFMGFVPNPLTYMKYASLFVLSSRFEGLGNVLIEALYCGCPIVSTDCPSGPSEILDGGKYGRLVPVGDIESLSLAMDSALCYAPDSSVLHSRSELFSHDVLIPRYIDLLFDKRVSLS